MGAPIMITSRHDGNVIQIQSSSTQPKALLEVSPSEYQLSLTGPPKAFAANQTWEILPDPAGSSHYIIQNPATGNCIDILGNSIARGTSLDAYTKKEKDNQNQLWDFIPDPYGSPYFFIQNPQTGYVIEIENGSSKSGALLVVNPRRLFDNNFQLWADWSGTPLPGLTLAQPTADLENEGNYVLLPVDQTKNLTGITITLDIIEDLVAESFSVQINGYPPYPGPKGVTWQTQWMQYGLFLQNNSLILFNQVWGNPAVNPLPTPSVQSSSGVMLQLKNNTVPAGTQIVLTLTTDKNHDDFLTGISGKVFDKSGSPIGTPVDWPVVGRPTWTSNGPGAQPDGPPVKESNLAPLGAFQVVVVGNPNTGGHAHFTSGMGTITVACTPHLSAQLYWPTPNASATGETSNCYYGKVQVGYFPQIVQPFGLPHPKMTSVTGTQTFAGTGLLPNSKLRAKASWTAVTGGDPEPINVYNSGGLVSQNDGSFSVMVQPTDTSIFYKSGSLSLTVYDADNNWASGAVPTDVPASESVLTSTKSGLGS